MDTHKVGINEAFLVKRKLKLTGMTQQSVELAKREVESIRGVDMVDLGVKNGSLSVSYDASIASISAILDILESHDIKPESDWWNRLKLSWDKQIDQNVRDNAKHVPHCCSKPPPGH
ncbi:MAG: Uncharacterised protein [Marinobacterium sp. xm-d-530]|jgi:copper chaperone CopZ|uniref:hypothetical protein n=1 Tax=Marinobacterium sp. xm-d-530 TaxID=2497747 RepID=UPI00156948D0|nr:hypothetical protein [Marinobacterium sp. xm-d-530]NRQ02162.1 hypothetical protein [Marinobacterium sp. xm-d-530]CAI8225912.1 MAG: Uncharacterised protein [Marinobacterium sp. xm-d-530]